MSYFNATQTNESNTSTDQGDNQTKDFIAQVVEKKGDHWNDPNEIAKGYLSSQEYIAELQKKLDELEKKAGQNDFAQEVLQRLEKTQQPPTSGEVSQVNSGGTDDGNQSEVSVDKIKELVVNTLTEQEAQRTAAQNLQEADRQLTEAFGTEAQAKVEEARQKLGMSKERLQQLASESPTAFLTLIGAPAPKQTNSTTTSSVNTASGFEQGSGTKNWAYYTKMRKENPKLYRSAKVQQEIMDQRMKLGAEAFYKT